MMGVEYLGKQRDEVFVDEQSDVESSCIIGGTKSMEAISLSEQFSDDERGAKENVKCSQVWTVHFLVEARLRIFM